MQDGQDDRQAPGSSVEVWGYRVWWPVPFVLVIGAAVLWPLLGAEDDVTNRDRRTAATLAALAMLPVFGVFTYRLRLVFEPARGLLTVTRRPLLGPGRSWRIPVAQLESWYYAESIQCFTLRPRDGRPLRFVLWMGRQPERLTGWATEALAAYADPQTGSAVSARAKRRLIGSVLAFVVTTIGGLVVIIATI